MLLNVKLNLILVMMELAHEADSLMRLYKSKPEIQFCFPFLRQARL